VLVHIVILTFNNSQDTGECLDSLAGLAYPDFAVTVVDNGSCDGSLERLRRDYPQVTFIRNEENLGFSAGNNVGIRHALQAGADLIWLLNNDTVVHPAALSRLVEAAEAAPRAGILGSKVYFYSEPERVHFAGGRVKKSLGRGIHLGMDGLDDGREGPAVESDFVTGASLAVRAEMIRQVGLLDPGFFLYLEDLDWCLRARRAGWRVLYVPSSRIWHKVNATAVRRRPLIIYYVCRNSLECCRKNFPAWLPLVFLSVSRDFALNYLARYLAKGRDPAVLEHARMGLRGIGDFMRRRMGAYRDRGRGEG
jgi:GT2 family glycosyltransferase